MGYKTEFVKKLIQKMDRIDVDIEDLEMALRENPQIDNDGPKAGLKFEISAQIHQSRLALREVDKAAYKLLAMYENKKINTYRKIKTVEAERFCTDDNKYDYYNKRYGIIKINEYQTGDYLPIVNPQIFYSEGYLYLIPTLEGNMVIENGDWILTGVDGEHWAVKNEIFNKTYEEVTDQNDD